MKKIVSIFMIMFFVSNFGFAKIADNEIQDSTCVDYAYRMAAREGNYYGGFDGGADWNEAFGFYRSACDEAKGEIEDVIFM